VDLKDLLHQFFRLSDLLKNDIEGILQCFNSIVIDEYHENEKYNKERELF